MLWFKNMFVALFWLRIFKRWYTIRGMFAELTGDLAKTPCLDRCRITLIRYVNDTVKSYVKHAEISKVIDRLMRVPASHVLRVTLIRGIERWN